MKSASDYRYTQEPHEFIGILSLWLQLITGTSVIGQSTIGISETLPKSNELGVNSSESLVHSFKTSRESSADFEQFTQSGMIGNRARVVGATRSGLVLADAVAAPIVAGFCVRWLRRGRRLRCEHTGVGNCCDGPHLGRSKRRTRGGRDAII
jgi:hypothetical protein